jgi:hypothetical protein
MQTALGLTGHVGDPPVDAERAPASFIERALFP